MTINCNYCKRAVSGQYFEYEDGAVCCEACEARLCKCQLCGKPLPGGEELCEKCAASALRCDACSGLITGKYVKDSRGHLICNDCYQRMPRCERCAGPMKRWREWTQEGRTVKLCLDCFESVDRCCVCGAPLTRKYYEVSGPGSRKLCETCATQRDRCDFCALPLGGTTYEYPDGRQSCASCHASAVLDDRALLALERKARAYLSSRFGLKLRSPAQCPARLADAATIARLQRKRFVATPGFDGRERGLFESRVKETRRGEELVAREEDLKIWIESGLPGNDAHGTLVHELTHLWQFDNYPAGEVDPRYVEGLACFLQHHALVDLGASTEAEWVRTNPDPVYGGGYRLVAEIEARVGTTGTISAVLKAIAHHPHA
jgi:hypothetical protein